MFRLFVPSVIVTVLLLSVGASAQKKSGPMKAAVTTAKNTHVRELGVLVETVAMGGERPSCFISYFSMSRGGGNGVVVLPADRVRFFGYVHCAVQRHCAILRSIRLELFPGRSLKGNNRRIGAR